MIMFYAKPFDEKMRKQFVKIWKKNKEKTCEQFFITFNQWYENKEKIQICFVSIKVFNNSQDPTKFTQQA